MYVINVNGRLTDEAGARISVLDRGFLYGDSVYEVTMTEGGKPIFLEEHLDRLERSAGRIGMEVPWGRGRLRGEVLRTLGTHGGESCYMRLVATRGEGAIALDPGAADGGNVVVIVGDLPERPGWWYEKGVDVVVSGVVRNAKGAIDPAIKSGNYLNNILAMAEARRRGAYDAVMLTAGGLVAEATSSNVWIVRDGVFATPPPAVGILDGITRRELFKVCRAEGFPVREGGFGPEEMRGAQEVFLTSATKGLVPVARIDGSPVGDGRPGPRTALLAGRYREHVAAHLRGVARPPAPV